MHPELQKEFLELVRKLEIQVVIATHSTAIVNEARFDEIVMIDKTKRSSRRLKAGEVEHGSKLTNESLFNIIVGNEKLIKSAISSDVRNEDLITIGYRKRQLDIFEKLLDDIKYFEVQMATTGLETGKVGPYLR